MKNCIYALPFENVSSGGWKTDGFERQNLIFRIEIYIYTIKKLVLASQFLFARYFLRFAREIDSLYWHCLVVVAFDASFHQLDQVPGVLLNLFVFANSQFWGILPVVGYLFPRVQARWYLPQLSIVRQTISDILQLASSSRLPLRLAWFPILRQLSFFIHFDHLLTMI
ncbi:Hypothetical_protein [Hexamita inflata]|uniref:Hypothetical_protein n=1 Tax=Hexamita inflata TaxID=28002 RepID=A0ABP1GUJ3_9EUKA